MAVSAGPADRAVIAPEAVDALFDVLRDRGYTVVGPTVRDGAIVLDEISRRTDLPVGVGDVQEAGTYRLVARDDAALFGYAVGPHSLRTFLSPASRTLWTARRENGALSIVEDSPPPTRYAFIGVRACEIAAVAVQDHVFVDGPFPEPHYTATRRDAFVVAVNCGAPAATCFCASMGTGPSVDDGYDLALTELLDAGWHRLLVHAGSDRGREVLAAIPHAPATDDDTAAAREVVVRSAARMTRRMDPHAARDVLAASLDHPRWNDVATRCLSCTNCTLVCPTCFCSTVDDVASVDGQQAGRIQHWDSCFTLEHSYLHGAGSVRADIRARYRQWLTHKLSTWWDQFGESGCVGCGRCITWCPAHIDITEEVAAIAGDQHASKVER